MPSGHFEGSALLPCRQATQAPQVLQAVSHSGAYEGLAACRLPAYQTEGAAGCAPWGERTIRDKPTVLAPSVRVGRESRLAEGLCGPGSRRRQPAVQREGLAPAMDGRDLFPVCVSLSRGEERATGLVPILFLSTGGGPRPGAGGSRLGAGHP